jgi:hypothetical protein
MLGHKVEFLNTFPLYVKPLVIQGLGDTFTRNAFRIIKLLNWNYIIPVCISSIIC